MQGLFHQVFDGYVDTALIQRLDESENQQMLCLVTVYHWLAQNRPYKSCRQLLKQIKPKKQTEKQAEEIFEMSNEAPSVTKAIEDFVQLRNMQMKNIDDRCSDLDDLSLQIIGTYMKRFDDAIDGLKVKYL